MVKRSQNVTKKRVRVVTLGVTIACYLPQFSAGAELAPTPPHPPHSHEKMPEPLQCKH